MRHKNVVASVALIAILASVAVPGPVGSRVPSPAATVDPGLFRQVEVAALARGVAMTIQPQDPGARSAGSLDERSISARARPRARSRPRLRFDPPSPRRAPGRSAPVGAGSTSGWHHDSDISWFGPGLYGNGTACGKTLTKTLVGVAHRTLPCGTLVTFRYKGVTLTVPVVDRGPFVAGRTWDLTHGACAMLGHCFTGSIDWTLARQLSAGRNEATTRRRRSARLTERVRRPVRRSSDADPRRRRGWRRERGRPDRRPARLLRADGRRRLRPRPRRAGGRPIPGRRRLVAARVDASRPEDVAALCREHAITHVLNAVDPRFVMPIFDGAFAAGADYLDMAMSLSHPGSRTRRTSGPASSSVTSSSRRPTPGRAPGAWRSSASASSPGLSDIFARYAQDHLFSEIDEVGIRDGANLVVDGYDFAPSFSIWTTIEECLNPPVIWEADRGWYTTPPFSEPEVFDFPEGIGPVECVNVEHEEVLLVPRWVKAKRVTFKYGLGDEFINVLKVLHMLGLDRTDKVRVGGVEVSPRDVVAAVPPGSGPARRPDARQDVCRDAGDRHRQGRRSRGRSTCITWSTTR